MDSQNTTELGFFAEEYAAKFLELRNYEIIDHNYRKPWGEIDIIAQKEGILIFVEVKANKKEVAGFEPETRAGWQKMRKVHRTARTYLAEKKYDPEQKWQIDVISITFDKDRGMAKIRHYKNIEIE